MTLVVNLGLSRYFEDVDARSAVLLELVVRGYTNLVREIVAPAGDDALALARVLEASRRDGAATVRWLEPAEAEKLLVDVRKHYAKHGTYASFAWSELDKLPAYNVQSLALTLDGHEAPPRRFALPGLDERLGAIDLGKSIANWASTHSQARVATALHKLAKKHRLVVHSA